MLIKRLDLYIALFIVTTLSACSLFPVADGAMGVTGNLGKYTGQKCIALILLRSEREVRRINLRNDALGSFSQSFTIAPRREEYKVIIECNGEFIESKKILYPNDLDNGFYLNFGELSE